MINIVALKVLYMIVIFKDIHKWDFIKQKLKNYTMT